MKIMKQVLLLALLICIFSASAFAQDTTSPIRTGASPVGALPAGTTSTYLHLSTNEPATCKFSMSQNVAYLSMPYFNDLLGTYTVTSVIAHVKNRMKALGVNKPILITEDDKVQSTNNFIDAANLGVGWGYYNDKHKQSVPANFNAFSTEDFLFFAKEITKS